jgi:ribonuclease HI
VFWVVDFRKGEQVARGYGIVARGMNATSNIAEYLGLVDGLEALVDIGVDYEPVRIIGDSKVVIEQMMGRSRISTQRVKPLHHKACRLAN